MTGLRQRQKADRRRRILEGAAELFRNAGYTAVRIDDIAASADVSVGTFYNYYGTKGDLLLAIVSMEVEEVLANGEILLADPPADVAKALLALIGGYYDHSLIYLSKEMWRTALAISIEAPDTPFSQRYTELDQLLTDQVCASIRALQRRGLARSDVSPRAIGEILFNNLNMMFIEFVKSETMSLDALHGAMTRQILPLATLLAPDTRKDAGATPLRSL